MRKGKKAKKRQLKIFRIYKDLNRKPCKRNWVAKVVFLIQMLLIAFDGRCNPCFWDIRLKILRWPNFIIAELWRAKRACGAPWVSNSTHPRKFGNHVTVHRPQPARPPVRPPAPQENQCSISHFLVSLVAQEDWYCTYIVHQCCDQLTAVKTAYPLTSIEYLFEVIRW